MAALLAEAAAGLLEAAFGAAEGEAVAVGAAAAADEAATAAAVAEGTAEAEAAAAKAAAAAEAAEAAAETAAKTAAEAAEAESATVEGTVKAQEEVEVAAKEAAEKEASLGARIGAELGAKIQTALNKALTLVKWVAKTLWNYFLLETAIDLIPEKYRKVLAGMIMSVAASATKLLKVSYKYQGLSGGSEEGKQVAKETKETLDDLHTKARKLMEPSNVKINKEEHEQKMKHLRQQAELTKKEGQKVDGIVNELDDVMKDYLDNLPHEGEEN